MQIAFIIADVGWRSFHFASVSHCLQLSFCLPSFCCFVLHAYFTSFCSIHSQWIVSALYFHFGYGYFFSHSLSLSLFFVVAVVAPFVFRMHSASCHIISLSLSSICRDEPQHRIKANDQCHVWQIVDIYNLLANCNTVKSINHTQRRKQCTLRWQWKTFTQQLKLSISVWALAHQHTVTWFIVMLHFQWHISDLWSGTSSPQNRFKIIIWKWKAFLFVVRLDNISPFNLIIFKIFTSFFL